MDPGRTILVLFASVRAQKDVEALRPAMESIAEMVRREQLYVKAVSRERHQAR